MSRRSGKQLGERSGLPREPTPWEPEPTIEPTDAHVMFDLGDGGWVQALIIEMRHDPDEWRVRVAWADRGNGESRVLNQWVSASRVRRR